MPLVAHNDLPAYARLRDMGVPVLETNTAMHQHIRELHIGLLNMMPDAALGATERQFFRLIGESNPIAQFHVHPFTLDSLERSDEARDYIDRYYDTFEQIKQEGLDALIITGANVVGSELSNQPFWDSLIEVYEWAQDNVTSTLCSCLATHAVLEFQYGQKRRPQKRKKWGVFPHKVIDHKHPLVVDINARFDVPHSRWNTVYPHQFRDAGLRVLVTGDDGCIHLATSADGVRTVFFQGHPEYDTISLLKEYKREVGLFVRGEIDVYPPFPDNYLSTYAQAVLREYRYRYIDTGMETPELSHFPDKLIEPHLKNAWHDTAGEVLSNWMGLMYQLTHKNRHLPFMDDIDPADPLGLIAADRG